MNQKSGTSKDAADKLVKGIKRKTRKQYSAEEKIRIVLAGLRGDLTSRVLTRVQKNGKVYPSHGVWLGRQIIRVSIINHATDRVDIDLLVDELRNALRQEA